MDRRQSTFYPRVFGTVTAAALGVAMFWLLRPFIGALLWAGLVAFLLFPLNVRLRSWLRGRPSPAALVLTLMAVLLVVVPTVVFGALFASQASVLLGQMQAVGPAQQADGLAGLIDEISRRITRVVPLPFEQVHEQIVAAGQQFAQSALAMGGSLVASIVSVVTAVVIALFVLFFFLRDGERMVERAVALVPLDDRRKTRLLNHLADVTRAVVLGSLVVALVQGTLVGIGFALAGIQSPVVFGAVAIVASLVPLLGTTLVWVPAAIWAGVAGHWGVAAFLTIWGVGVVSLSDNVVRPLFISSRARISTLPVFIGLLGGIAAFGPIGIFLGPVLVALVLALVEFAEEARGESGSG